MVSGTRAELSTRYFGDNRCRSIWHWQLITALTVVAMTAVVALLTPDRFTDWRFTTGVMSFVALTMIVLALPWHRLSSRVILAVPVLDALLIGLIVTGDTPAAAYLWVFPVAWVASYFSIGVLIGMVSLIAVLRVTVLAVLGVTVPGTINTVILMLTLIFVSVIMSVGAERNRSGRRLLRTQSDRLARALGRVEDQRARHQRIMDSLDVAIARVRADGVVEIANTAFRALYALEPDAHHHPARAVEYRSRRGLLTPASETTIARAGRGELFEGEVIWLFGVDGQWRALRASTKVIEHGSAEDGLLLLAEDITEHVDPGANEQAVRRSIAHELRNPLTAVLGHLDLVLERVDLDPAARRQLEVVEQAGTRMQELLQRSLSTPSSGHQLSGAPESDEAADLTELARASVEGFRPAARANGVAIDCDLEMALPIHGDVFRLRQAVDNLVSNAIKFTQRGGRVTVAGVHAASEVGLQVSDNGIGIAPDDLPRIFERDFRAEPARNRDIPGTGLGLSISQDIVRSQGGRFEVDSELGQGTQIRILLPVPSDHERIPA